MTDCTVLTITYNNSADVLEVLRSVRDATRGRPVEIMVVDNDSADETVSLAEGQAEVQVLQTGSNLGYSAAINRGRAARQGEGPLLIVNADLTLKPDAVTQLVAALDDPATGIAVPRILDEDGSLYHSLRREPTVRRAIGEALFGRFWSSRPAWLAEVVRDSQAYDQPHAVDWATGAALLVRPDCDAAVGDWDEGSFFLYSEEVDYAARARERGFRVQYVPEAVVVHSGGASGTAPELVALLAVNRIRYFSKRHGRLHTAAFRAAVALHALIRLRSREHRQALRFVLNRRSWPSLPGGR